MIVTAQSRKAARRTESGLQAHPLFFKDLQSFFGLSNRIA
jgi:hypothetical protein